MKNSKFDIPDEFWALVEPLIPKKNRPKNKKFMRRPGGGRKPLEQRRVFEAILYVLKTGAKWRTLSIEGLENASSVNFYFKTWENAGLFRKIWKKGLAEHKAMRGIAWEIEPLDLRDTSKPQGKRTWRPVIARRNRAVKRQEKNSSLAISA